ncbi:MAG: ferredoxin [Alphaproteobacteria bacterium]|nr:MAG: ferredoxin [Alphaproteobacteria bacterium]PZO41603.1 MAG: ferredoxin [Alphaproteobacteria bacterium]
MPTLNVKARDGEVHSLTGDAGLTLMEIIRDGGVDEILALCGGCCSCATCHIYVDEAFIGLTPLISDDEGDLLDSSNHRQANSRLACQVPFTEALDGALVMIAPED